MSEQKSGRRSVGRRWLGLLAAGAAAVVGSVVVTAVAVEPAAATGLGHCTRDNGVVTCRFGFTGIPANLVVPDGVTAIGVTAIGAPGGAGFNRATGAITPGGRGGRVTGRIAVTPGQVLTVTVGGAPTTDFGDCRWRPNECVGGFNGGGSSGSASAQSVQGQLGGGAGGGATDVRLGGTALTDRVLVAAGGGGGGITNCTSGGAGGDAGQPGQPAGVGECSANKVSAGGGAGTATAGGAGPSSGTLGAGGFREAGGSGGGGLFGGGTGDFGGNASPMGVIGFNDSTGTGGGGGGSNLVPAGGSSAPDDTRQPGVVLSYVGPLPVQPGGECVTVGLDVTCTFAPTASTRALVVPAGVTSVRVIARGAPGADGGTQICCPPLAADTTTGGRGAVVTADLPVASGQVLYATVGGAPGREGCAASRQCRPGYNGGGSLSDPSFQVGWYGAGPGGGASDVRVDGTALSDRVLVAAGGGGGGGSACGVGGSGGDADADGQDAPPNPCGTQRGVGGGAGTLTAGGLGASPIGRLLDFGGDGRLGHGGISYTSGGAGGGGLYGGAGATGHPANAADGVGGGGGGGGSSLVPAGGSRSLDDSRVPGIVISFRLPATVPGVPGAVTANPRDRSVFAVWSKPGFDGGSPLTGFRLVATPPVGSGLPVVTASVGVPASDTVAGGVSGLEPGVTYTIAVSAVNAVGEGPASTTTVVPRAAPSVSGTAPGSLVLGAPMSFAYSVSGFPAPVVSLRSGVLPPGLTLSESGVLSGSPTAVGTYTFTVLASNGVGLGVGAVSGSQVVSVVQPTAPGVPTTVSAVESGVGALSVAFGAPVSDGLSPITGYAVLCSSASGVARRATGLASPIVVSSLTGGASYTCVVRAVNSVGSGPLSVATLPVVVRSAPGAPTAVVATPTGTQRVSVAFTPPVSDGGSPITSYRAVCTTAADAGPVSSSGSGSPLVVAGLVPGVEYACRVSATNALGTSTASVVSNTFVVVGAPTAVSAVESGAGRLTVAFTPPVAGGSLVTGFVVVCSSPSGVTRRVTGVSSPIVVSSLTGGATYTCVAHAVSAAGTGPGSVPSTPATLVRTVPSAPTITSIAMVQGSSTRAAVVIAPPLSDGGSPVTSYRVVCVTPAGATRSATGPTSPLTVASLVPGVPHTCRASATNAIGTSTASAPVTITPPG